MQTALLLLALAATDFPAHEFQATLLQGRLDTGLNRQSNNLRALVPGPRFHDGWSLSYVSNRSRMSGLKLEISRLSDESTITSPQSNFTYRQQALYLLFGAQLKDNRPTSRIKPFLHILGGASRIGVNSASSACAATLNLPTCPARFQSRRWSPTTVIGGGLDIRLSARTDLRLLQIDYIPLARYGATLHSVRFGLGITFH